jgi:anaerobic magnesium-protoporphyrin IX monomethyl ester cyclase
MNRVLLFYPKTGLDVKKTFNKAPLSLLTLVPYLRKIGVDVVLIDQRVTPDWEKRLIQELESGLLCVGISSMSGIQIRYALAAARIVKRLHPEIPVVWGGPHPTIMPEQTVLHPLVDIVVIGEGEQSFANLVQCLRDGSDWKTVLGIGYKQNGSAVINPCAPLLDVETIPLPSYDVVNINDYLTTFIFGDDSLIIIPDRGCPHRCAFCSVPFLHRYTIRLSSPEKIVREIEQLKSMGINTIDLSSENFFPNKERVFRLCELLRERGLKVNLKAQCRIDYIFRYTAEELRTLRESGFVALQLGAESGSDRMLKFLKKGITVSQIIEANKKLQDSGISGFYSFMIGAPTETLQDVEKTIDLVYTIVEQNRLAHTTNLQMFKPLPGTDLYDISLQHGLHPPETLEGWGDYWEFEPPWFTPRERKLLKKIDLFSYFFDGRSIEDYYRKSLFRYAAVFYTRLVKWRFQRRLYWMLFEYPILRWLKSRFA